MSFVNGYLAVMVGESEETKQLMLAPTSTHGGQGGIWMLHGVVVQCDLASKLKLGHAFVWHQVVPPIMSPAASLQPCKQPPEIREKLDPTVSLPSLDAEECAQFNKGQCVDNTSQPDELHVCSYCLHMVQRLCHHTK